MVNEPTDDDHLSGQSGNSFFSPSFKPLRRSNLPYFQNVQADMFLRFELHRYGTDSVNQDQDILKVHPCYF